MKPDSRAIDDYTAARTGTALFDLGDEGRFKISGPGCAAALNALVSINLSRVKPYRGAECLVLRPNGELVATIVLFKAPNEFYLFTEAAAAADLYAYLFRALSRKSVSVIDLGSAHGCLCIVGPLARDVLAEAGGPDVLALPLFGFEYNERLRSFLFRVAYTGEFEYRLLHLTEDFALTRKVLEQAGSGFGIVAGGSDTLATLRLEVRSILASDIPPSANVFEAGLHWMIDFNKPALVGGHVLNSLKLSLRRRGVMLALSETGRARAGDELSIDAECVGVLARVAHSPTLGEDIGFAYIDANVAWVGVSFDVGCGANSTTARAISAPVVLTRSV